MQQFFTLIFFLNFFINPALATSNVKKITIFSGDKKASFFAAASGICNDFNLRYSKKNIECTAIESKGSESNLGHLANGDADFAIIKTSEFNKFFVKNFSKFEDKNNFVARIHDEYLTVLVQKNLGIKSLSNLGDRLVNIGSIGSTSALIIEKYFADFAIKPKKIFNLGAAQSFKMICDKKIDAWIYFVGHPNDGFKEVLGKCDLELVSISSTEIKNFLKMAPFFERTKISKNLYRSLQDNITTISTKTILAAKKNVDPEIVQMIKNITESRFKALNPES